MRRGENFNVPWGAPSMMALEGGGVGFQIGGQATDFVLLVMNDRCANAILSSKVKLGADASVAAGPVGRNATAETDVSRGFRQSLREESFDWHKPNDRWTLELGSHHHTAMLAVLRTLSN